MQNQDRGSRNPCELLWSCTKFIPSSNVFNIRCNCKIGRKLVSFFPPCLLTRNLVSEDIGCLVLVEHCGVELVIFSEWCLIDILLSHYCCSNYTKSQQRFWWPSVVHVLSQSQRRFWWSCFVHSCVSHLGGFGGLALCNSLVTQEILVVLLCAFLSQSLQRFWWPCVLQPPWFDFAEDASEVLVALCCAAD